MKFSVLMSSYCKDKPEELKLALRSIWDDQTLKPSEIVIVKDGPLTPELDAVLDNFASHAPVKFYPLEKNMGLGKALAIGVEACSCEYIARMDGDDISVPDRFEKQVHFLESNPEVSLCGGMIQEFNDTLDHLGGKRILPESHDGIIQFSKWRSPFNHMTVMYRKQAILDVGNYQHFLFYEDYWLWARVLVHGYRTANLADILVNVRAGEGMLNRRRGWRFFKTELVLAKRLKEIGLINTFEMLRNMLLRSTARLLPSNIFSWIYSQFCRK